MWNKSFHCFSSRFW